MFWKRKNKITLEECKEKYPLLFDSDNYYFSYCNYTTCVSTINRTYGNVQVTGLQHKITKDVFTCVQTIDLPNHIRNSLTIDEASVLKSWLFDLYSILYNEQKSKEKFNELYVKGS